MSFESGSVTFRMYYLQQPLPPDYLERFARKALPPISALKDMPMIGWVTGRHLHDSDITEETAMYGGYLRLALCRAERKVPASILKTECRIEELARMKAEGRAELDRRTRSEIRKEIEARLLPNSSPEFKGMALVYRPGSNFLLCEAISDKQTDALKAGFLEAMGFGLIPVSAVNAAANRLHCNVREISPSSFSPDCDDDSASDNIGHDFLTWFWFYSETRGGIIKLPVAGEFAIMIEGPLTFVLDGQGAHETLLRRGTPEISVEAKVALLGGKKLSNARLLIGRGKDVWQVLLDAGRFSFRGLKLPAGEKLDPISRFEERMVSIDIFTTCFLEIYDQFIMTRTNAAVWPGVQKEIQGWVSERTARK